MSLAAQIHEQNVPKYKTLLAIIKTILVIRICIRFYTLIKNLYCEYLHNTKFLRIFAAFIFVKLESMSIEQQREELHKTIWSIADELRGAVGGWEFKTYVLGTLFYRFISENLTEYINRIQWDGGDKGFNYADMSDEDAADAKDMMVEEKGFFILPSQLFINVCKNCENDENLNMTLSEVFKAIEASAVGTPSEDDMKGLFSDFNVNNSQLGGDVKTRNKLIAKVLLKVRDMDLGESFLENKIDAFGDAYEFLMTMYASSAGKSGGEFFTPQEVSELLAELVAADGHSIKSVYDPACGSGSLLLKFSKTIGRENPALKYYGQEINPTTYNLCRINMFLHNINYDNFDIRLGNTLTNPMHREKDSIEDDLIFEMELVKQIQINIPYILQLVQNYHDNNCRDKTIIASIQKAIGSSPDLRDKKDLIMKFIERITPSPGTVGAAGEDIGNEWSTFVDKQREEELDGIIKDENLRPDETKRFMEQAFSDGYVTTTGVAITKVLPPMPIFGGKTRREEKKRSVLEKLTAFFHKFFNV